MTIGEAIRNARTELGMTSADLADDIGVNVSTLREWERNERSPKWSSILLLIDSIGVDFLREALDSLL